MTTLHVFRGYFHHPCQILATGSLACLLCPSLSLDYRLKSGGGYLLLHHNQHFLLSLSTFSPPPFISPNFLFLFLQSTLPWKHKRVENLTSDVFIHYLGDFGLNLIIEFALAISEEEAKSLRLSPKSNCFVLSLAREPCKFYSHLTGTRRKHCESRATAYINLPFPVNTPSSKCMPHLLVNMKT